MKTIFQKNDKVKLTQNWRDWKKGEIGIIQKIHPAKDNFHEDSYTVHPVDESEKDFHVINIQLLEPTEKLIDRNLISLKNLIKYGFFYNLRDVNNGQVTMRWSSRKFGQKEYWIEFDLGGNFVRNVPVVGYCWLHWNLGGSTNFVPIPDLESIQTIKGMMNLLTVLSGKKYEYFIRSDEEVEEIIEKKKDLFSVFGLLEGQTIRHIIPQKELRAKSYY